MTQAGQEANRKLRDALSKLLTPELQEDIYGSAFLPAAEAVFASRDSKQVWQTSAVGQTYLNVKASHELVFGDSVGVAVTRANIYRLKLAHDDKALLKYPAPQGTPAADSEGPRITSLRGIPSQVTMDEIVLQEEDLDHDLYHYIDSPPRTSSSVNAAHVKQARLAYADVSIACAKRMVKVQWLDARQDFPALQNCQYASFTLSSADPLGPDLQSGISLEVNATGSEQSKKFFDAKGMQGYERILMPPRVMDYAGSGKASRLKYTRAKGQVTLKESDCEKNISYTNGFKAVSHCTKDYGWEVKTQSKLTNSLTAAALHTEVTAASMPMDLHVLRAYHQLGTVKVSFNAFALDFSSNESIAIQNKLGCLLAKGGVLVKSAFSRVRAEVQRAQAHVASSENVQIQAQAASMAITSGGIVVDQMEVGARSGAMQVSTANLTMVIDGGGAQPSPPPPMAPAPAVAVKAPPAARAPMVARAPRAVAAFEVAEEGRVLAPEVVEVHGVEHFEVGSAQGPRAGAGAGAGAEGAAESAEAAQRAAQAREAAAAQLTEEWRVAAEAQLAEEARLAEAEWLAVDEWLAGAAQLRNAEADRAERARAALALVLLLLVALVIALALVL